MSEIVWQPSQRQIEQSHLKKYWRWIEEKYQLNFTNYDDLHLWSIEHSNQFWSSLFEYFDIDYQGSLDQSDQHDWLNYNWFPQCQLNFAQNLLRVGNDSQVALNFIHESGLQKKVTYGQLQRQVRTLATFLAKKIVLGDVIAAYMPNVPETAISMLATSAVGGTFTSTSCDFGVDGVLDRFGQVAPKVLVTVAGYSYNGKYIDLSDKVNQIISKIESIEIVLVVDFLNQGHRIKNAIDWQEIVTKEDSGDFKFIELPFSHPQYIMYSSGTTGKPKCIVHSAGGTLLQHLKELHLHSNVQKGTKIFFFTTCGWMMWNWLVSALALGSEVFLYEGSPAYPSLDGLIKMLDQEKIEIWGTSPKFLRALEQSGYDKKYQLESLQAVMSTGAPLMAEQFDFVKDRIKEVPLFSISGGTDIIGCFMLGNPALPIKRGEIQCLGLGMDVACYDEQGQAEVENVGELVCLQSFPSQPIGFLNDSDHHKFKAAYFERYPGVWHHGDFITLTLDNSVIVHGRSDATLNPGGVRIGTAEIYALMESLDFIEDSVVVGRERDGDVDVVLFVQMKNGSELSVDNCDIIKKMIKQAATPRHVPRDIYQVSSIPYTRSGKKMELAVSRIINGKQLTNIEAVANPESLEQYEKYQ